MWPQIVWIAVTATDFGMIWAKHGEPHGPYDAVNALIAVVLQVLVLWWGGFFKPFFR